MQVQPVNISPTNADLMLAIQQNNRKLDQHIKESDTNRMEILLAINGFANYMQDNMVTKEEFGVVKQDVSVLKQDVSTLKQDVSELKQNVAVLNKKANDTEIILDGIATNVHTIQTDHSFAIEWLKSHDKKLDTHEADIKNLQFQLGSI
ncbi:MAG: hypothetical protein WC801_00580 [Patescibacteria group bacterium]